MLLKNSDTQKQGTVETLKKISQHIQGLCIELNVMKCKENYKSTF